VGVVIASAIGRAAPLVSRGRVREVKGVPVRTVRRWLDWWQTFALSSLWTEAKALFFAPVAVERLPASLLERIVGEDTLRRTLALIAPITTTSVRARIEMVV
jgi:hypothetical protein